MLGLATQPVWGKHMHEIDVNRTEQPARWAGKAAGVRPPEPNEVRLSRAEVEFAVKARLLSTIEYHNDVGQVDARNS